MHGTGCADNSLMERDDVGQRPTFGAFLRSYPNYYRGNRWARLQLVSVCFLVLGGVVRNGPLATMRLVGLTLLVVGPVAYGAWRWEQRKHR
jgi:hypothetical protein